MLIAKNTNIYTNFYMKMFTTKIFLEKVKVLKITSEKHVSRKISIREGSKEKFKRFIAPFQIV